MYIVIYSFVLQMGSVLSVQNKRLITLTVITLTVITLTAITLTAITLTAITLTAITLTLITLGGFHCTSVCYPVLTRTISQFNHLLNSPNKNAKKLTAAVFFVFYFQCC